MRSAVIVSLAIALGGCASLNRPGTDTGTNAASPDPKELRLGTTTRDEVVARYGQPRTERSWAQGDGSVAGSPFGMGQFSGTMSEVDYHSGPKSARLWFHDGKLVGYLSHDAQAGPVALDADKVAAVVPWKSTRDDVLKRLGEPIGVRAYPVAPHPGQEILTYLAQGKQMHVLIGVLGVVEEVRTVAATGSNAAPLVTNPPPVYVPPYIYTPPRTGSGGRVLRR